MHLRIIIVGVLIASSSLALPLRASEVSLEGDLRHPPGARAEGGCPAAIELFHGDLGAEIGVGCANPAGTSGGPNTVAVAMSWSMPPPIFLVGHFYNLFTQVSPNITALTFNLWTGASGSPGSAYYTLTGLPFAQGSHTVIFSDFVDITSNEFFFGHTQPQTDVGMRWGVDTSSGSAGRSYIRAPTCGADTFVTLDSLGFPGNWVMSVCANLPTPVELTSWGEVKAAYR